MGAIETLAHHLPHLLPAWRIENVCPPHSDSDDGGTAQRRKRRTAISEFAQRRAKHGHLLCASRISQIAVVDFSAPSAGSRYYRRDLRWYYRRRTRATSGRGGCAGARRAGATGRSAARAGWD
jgi:hypothetical protein